MVQAKSMSNTVPYPSGVHMWTWMEEEKQGKSLTFPDNLSRMTAFLG